jgi:alkaline phosphatase
MLLRMRPVFAIIYLLYTASAFSQPLHYSASNGHSHNDYRQDAPFYKAWYAGFGSIEADIFLYNNNLVVAHDREELAIAHPLKQLYLEPLQKQVLANNGFPFADTTKHLQILIDIKSEAEPSLTMLTEMLKSFPELISSPKFHVVISGNRPPPEKFSIYPLFIMFDGELNKTYSADALKRIAMMSANFRNYCSWKGNGKPDQTEWKKLTSAVQKAHAAGKPVRFWNAPDTPEAWLELKNAGVDFINTDNIDGLGRFLRKS